MDLTIAILTVVALFMFIVLLGLCCAFVLRKTLEGMSEEELKEVAENLMKPVEVV